jgi:hypothetical protein
VRFVAPSLTVNISFNCNMRYPATFTNMLGSLEIVNVDLVPSLVRFFCLGKVDDPTRAM